MQRLKNIYNPINLDTTDKATRRVIAPYVKVVRKSEKFHPEKSTEHQRFNFYIQNKPSVLLHDLTSFLSDSVDLVLLLHETSDVLKSTTRANGVTLYMVDSASEEIYQTQRIFPSERLKTNWKIQKGSTVAAYVAFKKEYLMVEDILGDERFPAGVGYQSDLVKSVLCFPIVTPDDDCSAVIELYRDVTQSAFNKNDLRLCVLVAGWMGAAIHQNRLRLTLQKQQELNDYLLDLTKLYFSETVAIEKMITEIVKFAKTTLGAERGAFFIIDEDSKDLIAERFEEGINENDDTMQKKNVKVRLNRDRSIAGLVARTLSTVNMRDAFNDPAFVDTLDEKTGFITRSCLCMPIMSNKLLGVVQVVNKINGVCFTQADENLFKTFSVYCALALHYTRLHQKMIRTEKMNECNLRLLQMQLKSCPHDNESFRSRPSVELPYYFKEFRWYISPEDLPFIPQLILYMFTDILSSDQLHLPKLMEFILSVKKSYRNNHYHNLEHAFNVMHCMYNILRRNVNIFSMVEIKALIIAALCHDLDHEGFTNNYLRLTDDNLTQLYEESPLENHNYRITMMMLNAFKIFSNDDKAIMETISIEIKNAILATDLTRYFRIKGELKQIVDNCKFDWSNNHHRMLIKSIMMISSDVSGNCKPFLISKNICDNRYKELYNEGDIIKKMGLVPVSTLDRDKAANIPEDQVQFLTIIVLPCIDFLRKILPNTNELYNETLILMETWQEIIQLKGQKSWRQDDSVVDQSECI